MISKTNQHPFYQYHYCSVKEAISHTAQDQVLYKGSIVPGLTDDKSVDKGDQNNRWCLSIEGGGKVSLETMVQHTLNKEVDGGNISAIGHFSALGSTTCEQASYPALTINNS